MAILTRDTIVVRRQDLLSADADGETVMMSLDQGRYFGLNGLGSRVWDLMQSPVSVDGICLQLESEYDVSPADCESAVLTFLSELARNDLISS